jgi:hypothetical protein
MKTKSSRASTRAGFVVYGWGPFKVDRSGKAIAPKIEGKARALCAPMLSMDAAQEMSKLLVKQGFVIGRIEAS